MDFFDGSLISAPMPRLSIHFEGWNFSKTSILSRVVLLLKGWSTLNSKKGFKQLPFFLSASLFQGFFPMIFLASTLGSEKLPVESVATRQLILRALEGVAQRTCSDVPATGGSPPPARSWKLVGDSVRPVFLGNGFFGVVTVTYIHIRYLDSISILGKDSATIVSRSYKHVITSYNIMFWLEYFACSTSANMLKIRSIGLITIPKPQHCMYDSQFILAVANI